MKGTVLDFSIAENSGVVTGDDGNRYAFSGSDWKSGGTQLHPGARVDFVAIDGVAAEVTKDAPAVGNLAAASPLPEGLNGRYRGLYCSSDERMILGLCGGLAHRFGIHAVVTRAVVFLVLMPVLWIPYLVGIFLPKLPTRGLRAEAAATVPSRRNVIVAGGALSLVLLGIAVWAYGLGALDWRYQLAGTADPFLGHPAPAVSVIGGIVLSAMLVALVLIARRNRPSSTRTGGLRWHWWWLLIAGWGGYVAGSAVTIAGSAPVVYRGTMHVEFGAPLGSVADVPATCRSVVGKPELVAQVIPAVDGLVAFDLRDGLGSAWGRTSLTNDRVPGNDFEPPNVADRPAPYSIYTAPDGSTMTRPAISFVRAYDYRVARMSESGLSGVADLTAARLHFADSRYVRWVNLTIPNDPWPETYELTVNWTCNATGP